MKKLSIIFLCFAAIPIIAQQDNPINWTLALQNVKTGDMVSFSTPIQSHTGEQYRLMINPASACYCYIIAESSDDNVGVLYSGPLKNGENWQSPVMQLIAPRGVESLFIVVSRTEQRTIALKITAFNSNSGSTQRRALMDEIFRLRSNISKFREEPEKPVLMGGSSRGSPDKNFGVEFSGLETYVKTISIEHQ